MEPLAGSVLLQVTDPTSVLDQPGFVRGPVAFVVILVIGAGLLRRYEALVDRCLEASIDRPLSALAYGVGTHLTIAFFGVYATSQLMQAAPSSRAIAGVGLWAGAIILVVAAALGFTVAGVAVVEFGGGNGRWYGLLLGASAAGVLGFVDPLFGVIIWLIVVSTAIGGPVRLWFHAAEDVESAV